MYVGYGYSVVYVLCCIEGHYVITCGESKWCTAAWCLPGTLENTMPRNKH